MELFIAFIASILLWLMFGGIILLWVVDGRIRKEQALHAFLSASVAWTISQMVKEIYPMPRPFLLNGRQILTLTMNHYEGSFPSSHAAMAFGIAFAICLHTKRLGILFFACAILVALGRVLSNVHYIIDIVGGGVIGVLTAYFLDKINIYYLLNKPKKK